MPTIRFVIYPVPVFPSQLDAFKKSADSLVKELSKTPSGGKQLSASRRYDYLAIALGYKEYSDLIQCAEIRSQAENIVTLQLFQHGEILEAIVKVFSSKIDCLDT